jgi:hypothetical protein
MTGRPSRVAHDLMMQRAIRALPKLPSVFTAKQLQRLLPDRSMGQCRLLMQRLVARGYCRPAAKHAVAPLPVTTAPETVSDRVLAMLQSTDDVTVVQAMAVISGSRRAVYRTLERMADLGLLRRMPMATARAPRKYGLPVLLVPVRYPVPKGCMDPQCPCPVAESDYDIRNGRMIRVICRRHETHRREVLACST